MINMEVRAKLVMNCTNKKIKLCFFGGGRNVKIQIDQEEYQKKSAIERFFRWIESCKKVFPIYEIKEKLYMEVVMLAAIIRLMNFWDGLFHN